jgi:hypothetical protein
MHLPHLDRHQVQLVNACLPESRSDRELWIVAVQNFLGPIRRPLDVDVRNAIGYANRRLRARTDQAPAAPALQRAR